MAFSVGSRPDEQIARGALQYQRQNGLYAPSRPTDFSNVVVNQAASNKVGDAYDALPEFDKRALPAYHQMRRELGKQFDFLTKPESKGGLGVNVNVTKQDPYNEGTTEEIFSRFRNDVVNNKNIDVLSTASTGGHPFFTNDENDMFRAVHDIFGHLGSGRSIDRHGEDAAYQKHAEMFSPLARQALATETRGQNAALHKHGDFQAQKVALLPAHMQSLQFMRRGASAADRRSAIADNIAHGILG